MSKSESRENVTYQHGDRWMTEVVVDATTSHSRPATDLEIEAAKAGIPIDRGALAAEAAAKRDALIASTSPNIVGVDREAIKADGDANVDRVADEAEIKAVAKKREKAAK